MNKRVAIFIGVLLLDVLYMLYFGSNIVTILIAVAILAALFNWAKGGPKIERDYRSGPPGRYRAPSPTRTPILRP